MTNDTKPEPIGEVIIGEDPTGLSKNKWTVVRWREGAPPIKVGTKLYDEAALAQARAVPETAWLVEWKAHGYGPQWWGFDYEPRKRADWCSDANNAVRFARKEDAERMRLHIIAVEGNTGYLERERSISVTEHEWCDGRVSAIAAAPSPAQPSDWRPIESAPRDGTDILLSNGRVVAEGHWLHAEPYVRENRDLEGRYVGQDESDGHDGWIDWSGGMQPEPTTWMPLPPPPAEKP